MGNINFVYRFAFVSFFLSLLVVSPSPRALQGGACDDAMRRILREALEITTQMQSQLETQSIKNIVRLMYPQLGSPIKISRLHIQMHSPFSFNPILRRPMIDPQNKNAALGLSSLFEISFSSGEKKYFMIGLRHYTQCLYEQSTVTDFRSENDGGASLTEQTDDSESQIIYFSELDALEIKDWISQSSKRIEKIKAQQIRVKNLLPNTEDFSKILASQAMEFVKGLYGWSYSEGGLSFDFFEFLTEIKSMNELAQGFLVNVHLRVLKPKSDQMPSVIDPTKAVVRAEQVSGLRIVPAEDTFGANVPYFFPAPETQILRVAFNSDGTLIGIVASDFLDSHRGP